MFITSSNAVTDAYFHGNVFAFPLTFLSTSSLIKKSSGGSVSIQVAGHPTHTDSNVTKRDSKRALKMQRHRLKGING